MANKASQVEFVNDDDELGISVPTQSGPWAMVPAWVLKHIKGSHLAVYVALRTFADRQGRGWPSTKTLAERSGVSVSGVRNAIQKMRALGILTTTDRRRQDGSLAGLVYFMFDVEPEDLKSDF